ncbi:unnamed protein product [Rotaria sp. Silwood1]|nr:unnamed protein product [Rotaria sp. Silwood1]
MPDRPPALPEDEFADTPGIAICDNRIFIEFGLILSPQSSLVIEPTTSEERILTRLATGTCVTANRSKRIQELKEENQ